MIPDPLSRQRGKPEATSASPATDSSTQQGQRPSDPASADDLMTTRLPGHEGPDAAVLADSRRHTRRVFSVAAAGAAAGYGTWRWTQSPAHNDGMLPRPQRRALEVNESVFGTVRKGGTPLAPTYPLSRAETLRINGVYGLKQDLDLTSWRLQLVGTTAGKHHPRYTDDVTAWQYRYRVANSKDDQGHGTKVAPQSQEPPRPEDPLANLSAGPVAHHETRSPAEIVQDSRGQEEAGHSDSTLLPRTPGLLLSLADLDAFPRHDLVTEFKCIEGWSQVVHWRGIRTADFLDAFPPEPIDGKPPSFAYFETPDGDYYVGYDLAVLRHPQTLLVTEMMGQPLTQKHGAPLRLHTPTKYGYKQIKRIGLLQYTNDKPDDYWTKLGYDWYASL